MALPPTHIQPLTGPYHPVFYHPTQVPSFRKYAAWAKKVAAKPRPKPGAGGKKGGSRKSGKAGSKADGEAALVAQIRARQGAAVQPFGGVLGKLMARYGGAGGGVGV